MHMHTYTHMHMHTHTHTQDITCLIELFWVLNERMHVEHQTHNRSFINNFRSKNIHGVLPWRQYSSETWIPYWEMWNGIKGVPGKKNSPHHYPRWSLFVVASGPVSTPKLTQLTQLTRCSPPIIMPFHHTCFFFYFSWTHWPCSLLLHCHEVITMCHLQRTSSFIVCIVTSLAICWSLTNWRLFYLFFHKILVLLFC